jgi:S-adenosylmethionine decarboxylase
MKEQDLFQLSASLELGAAQKEDSSKSMALGVHRKFEGLCDDEPNHSRQQRLHAGVHLIIELFGGEHLDSIDTVDKSFRAAVKACDATLLHIHLHRFEPHGVTGVAVLAESHITVHTWPERGYAAFDVFMCGDARPWRAVDVFREFFSPESIEVSELLRGRKVY